MLAAVLSLPHLELSPEDGNVVSITDLALDDGTVIKNHGSTLINYTTDNGHEINFFSSLDGRLNENSRNDFPFYRRRRNPKKNKLSGEEKYRVIGIYDPETNHTILGSFEQVVRNTDVPRAVLETYHDGKRLSRATFKDDSLREHLKNVYQFFKGTIPNPSPLYEAIKIIKHMKYLEGLIALNLDKVY